MHPKIDRGGKQVPDTESCWWIKVFHTVGETSEFANKEALYVYPAKQLLKNNH